MSNDIHERTVKLQEMLRLSGHAAAADALDDAIAKGATGTEILGELMLEYRRLLACAQWQPAIAAEMRALERDIKHVLRV